MTGLTSLTQPVRPPSRPKMPHRAPAPPPEQPRARRRVSKRFIAAVLLGVSLLIATVQVRATRSLSQQPSFFLLESNIAPGATATLVIDKPDVRGTYVLDLVFPDGASPRDYGIAFHESRQQVRVVAGQAQRPTDTYQAPNPETLAGLPDTLDYRNGVTIGEFQAHPAGPLTVSCALLDGPPWPSGMKIGLAHSTTEARMMSARKMARTFQPYSFGAAALLFCAGLVVCWPHPNPTPAPRVDPRPRH